MTIASCDEPRGWRLRFAALLTGIAIGIVGTAFRIGADEGYAGFAGLLAAEGDGALPGWLLGALAGAALTAAAVFLTRRFAPEAAGSGIQEIEGTLAGVRPPLRWSRILPVKFVAGILAMVPGLVLGREGPTIHMGGCAGGALSSRMAPRREDARVLVGAGAAAGLAVAFGAPLGGFLFALEELRREFRLTVASAHCVLLAVLAAVLVCFALREPGRSLPIPVYAQAGAGDLLLTVPFAILAGVCGVLFNAGLVHALDALREVVRRVGWLVPALVTGGAVGAIVFAWPDLTGGGEELVIRLLTTPQAMRALLVVLVARLLVFGASYAAGTPGGIFAPQLAFGALLGLLYAGSVDAIAPGAAAEPGRFAVAGMAALLTATVRAPLTALALVVEMTGSYPLLLMVLLAVVVADLTANAAGGRPIYETLLERTLRIARGNDAANET
ncbi:MAG: H(+)/Cl(-) exchange transporter ClcA [Deltaproteobacteria bacterium]|nr:H(+)/Cl(-) exchange transporter ClcA [Deltaproteobacteria bacterium]